MSLRTTILLLLLSLTLNHLTHAGTSNGHGSATLSWAGNSEGNIAGYRVYYRSAFEDTPQAIDVGNSTTVVFPNLLPELKYCFRLTAYNVFGLESPPSPEIVRYGSPITPTITATSEGIRFGISGKPGGTLDLYESTDLKNWTLIRTVINPTGYVEIVENHDSSKPLRFFSLGTSGDTLTGWLAQQELSDPDASYQGSPVSNQFAYSAGADLAGGYSKVQPTLSTINLPWLGGTETFATFNFTIREGTRDVNPRIERSHDLKSWIQSDATLTEISSELNGNGTRTISLREASPASQNVHGRSFYRLRFDDGTPAP